MNDSLEEAWGGVAIESLLLAALEVLVRLSTPKSFSRVIYEVPDDASMEILPVGSLPLNWLVPYPNAYLIELGGSWAREKRSLLLKVPSAVVRGEGWNYLVNPLHPESPDVTIADIAPFAYDTRLLGDR